MKNKYNLFEAFLPYTDFLFSVKDILEKTSKNNDFDLFVLEKIKEANLKHPDDRKSIKKLLDKNASEFRKKIGFNIKALTNYYDPIFQYMKNVDETSLEFCLGIANEFHNNFFSKESEDVKQLIIRGEIDFKEVIETINVFREINQITSGDKKSKIGERLVYEDDNFIVYYPRSHKYFVDIIRDLNYYKIIDWCTRDLTEWLRYNKQFACCILIAKKANKDYADNMQLVSYKIKRKDDYNTETYETDYEETCNFFNHHMDEKEFEDFYPGFTSNIAQQIEENVKEADAKTITDTKEVESQLHFCFKKRNQEIFEVVLNKYLDISIEKYYKTNSSEESSFSEEKISIGSTFVEHMTNILKDNVMLFENSKEVFFSAISNILVSNTNPSQNILYINIIKDFIEDLKTINYNDTTLTNSINEYIVTKSMTSSMHVNFYYYILFMILDEAVNEDAGRFDTNKKEIGAKCVNKILNSKSEVACNIILSRSAISQYSIQDILSTEIFETIFNTEYFEKLMLGKIENIQASVLKGIADLIKDVDTFGHRFANELYNSKPEFNKTLKTIVDIFNIKLVNSNILSSSESHDNESITNLILYNDLDTETLNSLYSNNFFKSTLIEKITELDFITNNKSKVQSIFSTIDRFKENRDAVLLYSIRDESIPYILNMNLPLGKTLKYIISRKDHIILDSFNNPETNLYDNPIIRNYFSNNRNKFIEGFEQLKHGFLKYFNDLIEFGESWDLRNKVAFFNIMNSVMKSNKDFAKKVFEFLNNNLENSTTNKTFLLEYFLIKNKIFDSFDDILAEYIDSEIAVLLMSVFCNYLDPNGEKIYLKIIESLDINYMIDEIFERPISGMQRKAFMKALLEKVSEFYGEKPTIDLIKTKIENVISRRYYSTYNVTTFIEIYRQFVKEKKISSHLNHALYPTIQKFIEFMNVDRVNKIPKDDLKVQNRFESVIRQYIRTLLN